MKSIHSFLELFRIKSINFFYLRVPGTRKLPLISIYICLQIVYSVERITNLSECIYLGKAIGTPSKNNVRTYLQVEFAICELRVGRYVTCYVAQGRDIIIVLRHAIAIISIKNTTDRTPRAALIATTTIDT